MVHVGIIPDGNRRWSKNNDNKSVISQLKNVILTIIKNYNENFKIFEHLNNITEISMYVLSEDNFDKRNDDTLSMIEELLYFIDSNIPIDIYEKVKFQFIGEIYKLPNNIKILCDSIMSKCTNDTKFKISFAMCYNPIKDSTRILINDKNRQKQSDIDVVIRSGSEKRISGFFPIKILYSELFFIDKLFPDCTLYDLDNIMGEFFKRERRYGA